MDEIDEIKKKKLNDMINKTNAPNHPIVANDDNFDQLIEEYPLIIVDFWAEWCMPCKMYAPTVEEFAKENQGKVAVAKLNVDDARMTAMKYNIVSIPTTMIFKNGKYIDRVPGAIPKSTLIEFVKRYE